jgi:hypothetical protein
MDRHRKLSIFLALIMATVAMPDDSWAGGNRYGGYYGYGHGYQGYNSGHYYPGYYGGRSYYYHGSYPGYYYPGYYGCGNCGNNHHHNNNNNNNEQLWLGLLGGGILGYGLNAYLHSNTANQGYYPQAYSAPPP